jgi:hypothetical protein
MPNDEPGSPTPTETEEQDQRTNSTLYLAAISTITSILAGIAAYLALPTLRLRDAIVVSVIVLPICVGLLLPGVRRYRNWPVIGPIIIGLLAGMLAITVFGWIDSLGNRIAHAPRTPTVRGSPHPSVGATSLASSNIRFLDPQNGALVKQCPQVDGTGVIPPGYGLWIIVVPNTNVESKEYWVESQAKADGPDHWSAINSVSIGSPATSGTDADIYTVLIDRKWSNYFAVSSASGNFDDNSLPPTSPGGIEGPISVVRVSGAGFCH